MTPGEIEDGVLTHILASLVTCFLIGIEREMPEHSKKARLTRKVEEAIMNLSNSTTVKLDVRQTEIGVTLYNKLLEEFQTLLEGDIKDERERLVVGIQQKNIT